MQLFQYAIIWQPTESEIKEGKRAKVVKDITSILARDKESVNILAAREIPEEYLTQLDQINIAVRPF